MLEKNSNFFPEKVYILRRGGAGGQGQFGKSLNNFVFGRLPLVGVVSVFVSFRICNRKSTEVSRRGSNLVN